MKTHGRVDNFLKFVVFSVGQELPRIDHSGVLDRRSVATHHHRHQLSATAALLLIITHKLDKYNRGPMIYYIINVNYIHVQLLQRMDD